MKDKIAERGNPVLPPGAIPGRHYHKACCRSGGRKRLEEANAAGKAVRIGHATWLNMKIMAPRHGENVCRRPTGVLLREKLENLWGWESKRRLLRLVRPSTNPTSGISFTGRPLGSRLEGCRCVSQRLCRKTGGTR